MTTGAVHPLDIGRPRLAATNVTSITPRAAAARATANETSAAARAAYCGAALHVPSLNALRFRWAFKDLRERYGHLTWYAPFPCSSTSQLPLDTDDGISKQPIVNGDPWSKDQYNTVKYNDSSEVKRITNESRTNPERVTNESQTNPQQTPITGYQTTVRSMLSTDEITARIKLRTNARKALFNCIWGIAHSLALEGTWRFRLDAKHLQRKTALTKRGVYSGIQQFIKSGILCKHSDGMSSWGLPFKNQSLGSDDDVQVF